MLWFETPINLAHVLIKILFLVKYVMDRVLHINKGTILIVTNFTCSKNNVTRKFSDNFHILPNPLQKLKNI